MVIETQVGVRKISSVDPATCEVLRTFEAATAVEVNAAVSRARAAQNAWCELGAQNRIAILGKFRRLVRERKTEISRLITRETGKPQVEALSTEVLVVLDAADFYVKNGFTLLRDEKVPHANLAMKTKSGWLVREPYGVI